MLWASGVVAAGGRRYRTGGVGFPSLSALARGNDAGELRLDISERALLADPAAIPGVPTPATRAAPTS